MWSHTLVAMKNMPHIGPRKVVCLSHKDHYAGPREVTWLTILGHQELFSHFVVLGGVSPDNGCLITMPPPPEHKIKVMLCVDSIIHVC